MVTIQREYPGTSRSGGKMNSLSLSSKSTKKHQVNGLLKKKLCFHLRFTYADEKAQATDSEPFLWREGIATTDNAWLGPKCVPTFHVSSETYFH